MAVSFPLDATSAKLAREAGQHHSRCAAMKEFPPFRFDTVNQCLWRRGETGQDQRVLLTPKAFAVLRYLVEHAGRLVTQDELLQAIWPDTFIQPEVLKYQIADIRSVLGDHPKNPLFIETLPRRGYRFVATVRDSRNAESPTSTGTAPGRLVGREPELHELRTCFEQALRGQRQMIFITGEPGIGKTALIDEFQRQAVAEQPSLVIARGQCVEGYGGTEAYYPMLEALGQLCRGSEGNRVVEILAAHAPTWLVQFPSLVNREQRQALQQEILGATRDRMLREICDALDMLNLGAPLLWVFEDLQWVDPSTVDLISATARRRRVAKAMVILTMRPVDMVVPDHPLRKLKSEVLTHRLCREIALPPLSEAAVAEYLSGESGSGALPAGFAELIHRNTGGNPLFMIAELDHMTERGLIAREDGQWRLRVPVGEIEIEVPETLRQVIEAQIEHLTSEEQRALEVASVAGIRFPPRALAEATQQDADILEELFERLTQRSRMIRAGGPQESTGGSVSQIFEFVHALYREVFYRRQTPARRAGLHRRIGQELEKLFSHRVREIAAELANHFERGCDSARAIKYLRVAARNATGRLAPEEAGAIVRHAVELANSLPEADRTLTQTQLLADLARIYQAALDPRDLETYEAVAAHADRHHWPEIEADALLDMAPSLARTSIERLRETLERAATVVAQVRDSQAQAILQAKLFGYLAVAGAWSRDAARKFRDAYAEVPQNENALTIIRGFIQWHSSEYHEACNTIRETRSALAGNDPETLSYGGLQYLSLFILPRALLFSGEWGEALRENDAGIAAQSRTEERAQLWRVNRAWVLHHALDFVGVRDTCEEVLPFLVDAPLASVDRLCRILAGSAETALGNYDRAMEHFSTVQQRMDRQKLMEDWFFCLPLESGITDLFLAKSDLSQARLHAEKLRVDALATDEHTWQALAWETNARVAMAGDDLEPARQCVEEAAQAMQGFDVPLAHWRVHATGADVFKRLGNVELADQHRELSRKTILKLADSLALDDPLRHKFLTAPQIRRILEDAAAAG